jgi:cell division transport system permease protein
MLHLTQIVEAKVEIVAFFNDLMTPADTDAFIARLKAQPLVAGVEYHSKEDAAREFGADPALKRFLDLLGTNPLPASVRIRLREKNPENVRSFATWLTGEKGVEETTYGGGDADRLLRILGLVRLTVIILTLSLGAAAVIIIGNIISLMVFARKEEIHIMRMAGATTWFIRAPFLLWGIVQGVAGAWIASGLLYGIWRLLSYYAWQDLSLDLDAWLPPDINRLSLIGLAALSLIGLVLGLAGSLAATGRHVRE